MAKEIKMQKFKRGQVVAVEIKNKTFFYKILHILWNEGWFYKIDRKNCLSETMLRELTQEETGIN